VFEHRSSLARGDRRVLARGLRIVDQYGSAGIAAGDHAADERELASLSGPFDDDDDELGHRSELLVDPVHHRAQLLALALDLVVLALGSHALEVLLPRPVLGDPLLRELPRLDLPEDLLHRLAGGLADHAL